MEIETTISKIGDSYFVRIPAEMAKYFRLTNGTSDGTTVKKAKIKDLSDSEVKISFTIW